MRRTIPTNLFFRALLAIALNSAACGTSEDPASKAGTKQDALLGFLFDGLFDRVDKTINNLQVAGQSILVQAGSEAYAAIGNAKSAYTEMLTKTLDGVDDKTAKTMQQLEAMVTLLERKTAEDAQKAMAMAQTISNSLPFANHEPQVAEISPHFLAQPRVGIPVVVSLRGNFFDAAKPSFQPVLRLGDVAVPASEVSTQVLRFTLPADTKLTYPVNGINTYTAKIEVPFESGLLAARRVSTFPVLFGLLPSTNGKAKVHGRKLTQVTDNQRFITMNWSQHSSSNDLKKIYCGPTHPGWDIVQGKDAQGKDHIQFKVDWAQGNQNDQWSQVFISTLDKVCNEVYTEHSTFGTSGKVDFHFEYDLTRTRQVETWEDTEVQLRWGESRTFPYEPNYWSVIFDSFLAERKEFAGFTADKYLITRSEGKGVTLRAPELSEISW